MRRAGWIALRSRLGRRTSGRISSQRSAGQGPLLQFLLQFHQPLIYILLLAAVVTGVFKEWVDAVLILGVVVINAIVGFIQESKALGAIAALAKSIASEATVVRNGQKTRLPAASLVPGTSCSCNRATRCRPTCALHEHATFRSTNPP